MDHIDVIAAYLNGEELPEGVSLGAVLNSADPKVRRRLGALIDEMDAIYGGVDGAKSEPFGDRHTVEEVAKVSGLPPQVLYRLFNKIHMERSQAKLQERFAKSDEYRKPSEPDEEDDRRSAVARAMAAHGG